MLRQLRLLLLELDLRLALRPLLLRASRRLGVPRGQMLSCQVLAQPGVVTEQPRTNGAGEWGLFCVLLDVDFELEVV